MNKSVLAQISVVFVIILSLADNISQPSYAQPKIVTFICVRNSDDVPITIARTLDGDVPLIHWTSEYFSESAYNPERLCEQVATKLQVAYDNNTLRYITTGTINGLPVACIARSKNGLCSGLLFAFQPGSNPNVILSQLIRDGLFAGRRHSYSTLASLDDNTVFFLGNRLYVDLNRYIHDAIWSSNDYEYACDVAIFGNCK